MEKLKRFMPPLVRFLAPVTTAARTFATLEGILGQLYLTILVARLVGMHLAGQGGSRS